MNKSESIANLSAALSKFQCEVSNPSASKEIDAGRYQYKYAPLDEIISHIRPTLSKHGLAIIQAPVHQDGMVGVSTTLLHSSGEYIDFPPILLKLDKNTAQGAGSAITYARRYALSSVLGIASEEDDDGGRIEGNQSEKNGRTNKGSSSKPAAKVQVDNYITEAQEKLLDKLLIDTKYDLNNLKDYLQRMYGIKEIKELNKNQASEIIKMLKNIKNI